MANLLTAKKIRYPDSISFSTPNITAMFGTQSYILNIGSPSNNTLYFLYLLTSSGSVSMVQSTTQPSVYMAANPGAVLVGAYYTDNTGNTLARLVNKSATPSNRVVLTGSGTYTTPSFCPGLEVELCGGGGSGGTNAADGTAGAATTFSGGTVSMTGNPGAGAGGGGAAAAGGTASGGDINLTGGGGGGGGNAGNDAGGCGGTNPFGGSGPGGGATQAGQNASAGTGAGGGGSASVSSISRAGGGAGGYCKKTIPSPVASYSYSVGNGGTAPSGAGNGGSGTIVIEELRLSFNQIEVL